MMKRIAVAVALCVLPVDAAAQAAFAFQPGACETAAKEFSIKGPADLPPPPVCPLDQGCVRVDWNIAPQQELKRAAEFMPLARRSVDGEPGNSKPDYLDESLNDSTWSLGPNDLDKPRRLRECQRQEGARPSRGQ